MVDPMTDPYPERMLIHNNTFMGNGTDPQVPLDIIGVKPLEDVLWDGISPSGIPESNDAKLCFGKAGPYPSFRMFAADKSFNPLAQSTDITPYECDDQPASPKP
jgi:hypothetical protein